MRTIKKRMGFWVLASSMLLGSCTYEDIVPHLGSGDDSSNGVVTNKSSAIEKALALFQGTVREVEMEIEEGVRSWKVDIIGDEGSEVEIYIRESNGALFRIDGEAGPFFYEIVPGEGFISYSEAKAIAESIASGDFSEWRLRQDDSYNMQWVYSFKFGEIEIVLRASDGEVLDQNGSSSDGDDSKDDDSSNDDSSSDDSNSDGSSNDDNSSSNMDRSEAREKALSLFSGTVREIQRELEEGVPTWKVDIRGNGGAEVEIYLRESDGSVFRIDGESAPFSYNIAPGHDLVGFAKAKQMADARVNESLEEWRLRKDDSYNNQWVYEMKYDKAEVIVRATDAKVLEVKE